MKATPQASDLPLCFGRFELRPREYRLLANGQAVPLGGRAMDLLLALAARPGELLTRHELIDQVWPGRVVEDNNLSVQVKALRKALGAAWLVTVPGRGYRLDLPSPTTPPAPTGASSPARTLPPAPPLALIGREADVLSLHALVDQHRLVTVTGAGGIGKTRLAQTLTHARSARHPDGICWVELGQIDRAEALPGALAAALGLPVTPADTLGSLVRTLNELHLLLTLDNAEHLLDAVASLVQTLLGACSGLRVLVTSQAPLKLAAEHVLHLGPLTVPAPSAGPMSASQAQGFGAIALFCDRAAAADHRFRLDDADAPAVVDLCQSLHGLPLAIELAAARVASLGIESLRSSLFGRMQLLGGNRDRLAPPRQHSLRAALEWSVGLLATPEARLFRRLGVMAGNASLALVLRVGTDAPGSWETAGHAAMADAETMAGAMHGEAVAMEADAAEVVDALDELIQRSLVEPVHDEALADPRYRLLELPRALALDMLRASGEVDLVRQRHAQGVLADERAWRAALHSGRLGPRAVQRLQEMNLANAREALQHARRCGDKPLELALASAAIRAATGDERLALAERCNVLAADTTTQASHHLLLQLHAQRAISVGLANVRPAHSHTAARLAVELARRHSAARADRFELYDALCALAHLLADEGSGEESARLLNEALALEDPAWPAAQRRTALRVRASQATHHGLAQRALALHRSLLEAELAAGENGHVSRLNLANAELAAGDAAAAVTTGRQLVTALTGWRNRGLLIHASANLMQAELALDALPGARALAEQLWGGAQPAPLHAWFVDTLALLAALEGRNGAAAQLVLAANTRYGAATDRRELNEQRAHERTLALLAAAGSALPPPPHVPLADAELIALALGRS